MVFHPFTQLFLFPFTQLFLVPFTQLPAEFFVSIEAVAFGFLVLSALDTLYAHWGQFFKDDILTFTPYENVFHFRGVVTF